jgi:hypothetical protein
MAVLWFEVVGFWVLLRLFGGDEVILTWPPQNEVVVFVVEVVVVGVVVRLFEVVVRWFWWCDAVLSLCQCDSENVVRCFYLFLGGGWVLS